MAVCATTLSQSAAANDAARSFPRLFVQVDAEDKGAMCSSVKDTISQVVGCSSAVLAVEPVTGGLSNYLFKVVDTQQTPSLPKPLLVRVFGPLAMDRERENRIFAVLAKEGIGPSLLATFGNGRVEEFLDEYHTLEPSEFLGERHGQAVAERLATLHSVEVARAAELSMGSESAIWGQLEQWLEDASAADFSARPQDQQAQVQKILGGGQGGRAQVEADLLKSVLDLARSIRQLLGAVTPLPQRSSRCLCMCTSARVRVSGCRWCVHAS